jgi:predicted flap endonuclease-1-like 5' DNA nuclease
MLLETGARMKFVAKQPVQIRHLKLGFDGNYCNESVFRMLKWQRITHTLSLLKAAAKIEDRESLAIITKIPLSLLTVIVQRADLSRINGLGTRFAQMLAEVGVRDLAALTMQDPRDLHQCVRAYNRAVRLTVRSPTLDEIVDWIAQARELPTLVTYAASHDEAADRERDVA